MAPRKTGKTVQRRLRARRRQAHPRHATTPELAELLYGEIKPESMSPEEHQRTRDELVRTLLFQRDTALAELNRRTNAKVLIGQYEQAFGVIDQFLQRWHRLMPVLNTLLDDYEERLSAQELETDS